MPPAAISGRAQGCHGAQNLWRRAVARIPYPLDGASLDDTFTFREKAISVRWMWQHLVEEYARHNGHADLLREAIDGSAGL